MIKYQSKIKSAESLKKILLKLKNKKTVFTNGCFDILHLGHTDYLEKAKNLGDVLIVAVNSDLSVKKLKGPSRPINCLKDRLGVIAALQSVDFVTWFSEDTPTKLIKKLKPMVLVKGGDYKVSEIAGHNEIKAWGGKVKLLPFLPGRSTSKVIKRANN